MTPFFEDAWLAVYGGDCRAVLSEMPADSVDCVVTSPPYWGLRDYGTEGQLGLERTPEEYVANMVAVFAEVKRVLKPSGTCWLNLGDSYAGSGQPQPQADDERLPPSLANGPNIGMHGDLFSKARAGKMKVPGLAQKQLVGIPWRVAFALQADGWYLRSDIIWSKPNPMPESVTDRPTKSHEYLFLLTKSSRYFFDADAVREPHAAGDHHFRYNQADYTGPGTKYADKVARGEVGAGAFSTALNPAGRNIRSVWTIATRPYPGAHFAVFPPELPERCIKAGSSERGVCPECGAPWERVTTPIADGRRPYRTEGAGEWANGSGRNDGKGHRKVLREDGRGGDLATIRRETTGWQPNCDHPVVPVLDDPVPAVILDPFAGSGTVGLVANRLSRRAILIDLNPEYLKQQLRRNAQTPLGLSA